MTNKLNSLLLVPALFFFCQASAQPYAPPVGQLGTSAMHKDSSAFIGWVTACLISRGYQDLSNTSLGFASVGDSSMAYGKAQSNGIVSLGDGGSAVCSFSNPIANGPGFDFAVFENGFDDTFLELAFVEVSSDGINFVRFPAHSLTDTVTQTAGFGPTDATRINNLAGKYRGGYGTPFDLSELAGAPNLNVNAITHVKIVDVVGSLNKQFATYDSYGRKVNDPWPTAFPSGGFDLDAIGVIHESGLVSIHENDAEAKIKVFPNPANSGMLGICGTPGPFIAEIIDCSGKVLLWSDLKLTDVSALQNAVYTIKISTAGRIVSRRVIVQK